MQSDAFLLILGGVFGFVSALLLELIKHVLDKKRANQDRQIDKTMTNEDKLRAFINANESAGKMLAWLKLMETVDRGTPQQYTKDEAYPYFRVIKQQDNKPVEKFILMQTQVIGRQKDCEICLQDQFVSRLHALLRFENNAYVLYDLGSSSGTFVNSTQVDFRGRRLKNDDRIRIGRSVFIFEGASGEETNQQQDQDAIVADSNSNMVTRELKNCSIHGPFAAELVECPICSTLEQRRS